MKSGIACCAALLITCITQAQLPVRLSHMPVYAAQRTKAYQQQAYLTLRADAALPDVASYRYPAYTAFFCKMELRAINKLGIWIKVHAGDYDTYTR